MRNIESHNHHLFCIALATVFRRYNLLRRVASQKTENYSKRRICNITTIIKKKPWKTDITIILIDEDLGLSWDDKWSDKRINNIKSDYKKVTGVYRLLPPKK